MWHSDIPIVNHKLKLIKNCCPSLRIHILHLHMLSLGTDVLQPYWEFVPSSQINLHFFSLTTADLLTLYPPPKPDIKWNKHKKGRENIASMHKNLRKLNKMLIREKKKKKNKCISAKYIYIYIAANNYTATLKSSLKKLNVN